MFGLMWVWCACTDDVDYIYEPGNEPSADAVDADGDGFYAWYSTSDSENADCDDSDPDVTPFEERYIPAGNFWRGDDTTPLAGPMREIYLSDYCLDRFEVRNDAFAAFLQARLAEGYQNENDLGQPLYDFDDDDDVYDPTISFTDGTYAAVEGRADHPVTEVWHWSADAFCQFWDKELPTEAQWEKGARGTDRRRYPWGDVDPDCEKANYGNPQQRCVGDTLPVGMHEDGISPYGLHDMAGNVSEWVWDYYQADYFSESEDTDPLGPDSGFYEDETGQSFVARIARSGNHSTDEGSLQVFHRTPEPADGSSNGLGFRCARILTAP
ncbi:MAG: SUMF1/EgtB/PvdO family nonheme iron enzyme [Myxococcota bacterium]|nr:SUMF1/EgtB/PvdO family nonheme iron enzyme [Myxococcota bacterium]